MIYTASMHTPAAKKLRKTTFSQNIAPHSSTLTSNSGPVSVYFVSGELTGKERDPETGLYYYGARYLDPRTSRWISADPAMWEGDYIPGAPINDQERERNQNLGGMGGIFNFVNFHVYHYSFNNPMRVIDPDGRSGNEIVIFNALDLEEQTLSQRGYKFLVNEGFEEIKAAAAATGMTVRVISGRDANLENLLAAYESDSTSRIIILAHGTRNGNIIQHDGTEIRPINFIGAAKGINLASIDIVACYANNQQDTRNQWQNITRANINTFNPIDRAIMNWGTNAALSVIIPTLIINDNTLSRYGHLFIGTRGPMTWPPR